MTFYADYLLRAGATVVPMRPVGRQINEVVLDNDSAGVTFTGSVVQQHAARSYYDEDYGAVADAVPLPLRQHDHRRRDRDRHLHAEHSRRPASIRSTPGCCAAPTAPTSSTAINHTGGAHRDPRRSPQGRPGWVYLGTYHFNAGSSAANGSVQISNKSPAAGKS